MHHPSWLTRQCGGRSLSKNAFFIDPPCLLSAPPTPELLGSDMKFISLSFFGEKKQRFHYVGQTTPLSKYPSFVDVLWITRCQKARSKALQLFHSGIKAATLQVPAPRQHSSLPRPLHCSTMQILSGGRSKAQRAAHRESSDPHRLWDQVHNVRDQYTRGIVPQPLSTLSYHLAPIY